MTTSHLVNGRALEERLLSPLLSARKFFSEAVADDFKDGRVIHESMESFCPGSTADNDDIFRRIEC